MVQDSEKNVAHYIGLACGFLAIAACIATIVLSINDYYVSIYTLFLALVFLGLNRIGLHFSNFRKHIFENLILTILVFIVAGLVSVTKYSIYFLISGMFCYSLITIFHSLLRIKEDRSTQSIIFNILCIVLAFLFSFVFFFPAIYEKHASTVSNSNFIVLCFSAMIIVSSGKNLILPYHRTLKINVVTNVIKKSMINEIILSLLILIILCSVYFTLAEPNITSYVDGLWYSFAVITTIGFGDVYVTTTFGRILSVILGISGIAVVAVFTSFIVNFYNEMSKKREQKSVEEKPTEEDKQQEDQENKE